MADPVRITLLVDPAGPVLMLHSTLPTSTDADRRYLASVLRRIAGHLAPNQSREWSGRA